MTTAVKLREARNYLKEAVLFIPRLVRLLYRLLRDPGVSKEDKILVAAVVAYVVSPVDFVPDFIPLAGQVDDLLAVCIVLLRLIANSGDDTVRKHWSGPEDLVPWIHKTAQISRVFLPDRIVAAVFDRFGGKV